jgi:hypothetical protein
MLATFSNVRNAATVWAAAAVTSLVFVSAAVGPFPIS